MFDIEMWGGTMAGMLDNIRAWIRVGKEKGATHLLIVCDTFKHEEYPVYVLPDRNVKEVYDTYSSMKMSKVMEVYSFSKDIEMQLTEDKAMHLD